MERQPRRDRLPPALESLLHDVPRVFQLDLVAPVRRAAEGVEPLAAGHWPAQALTRADGWVLVPPESEGFAAGRQLEMRAFP